MSTRPNNTGIRAIAGEVGKNAMRAALGERLGLYRDYPVSKGCTSPFLPIGIGSVVAKKEQA